MSEKAVTELDLRESRYTLPNPGDYVIVCVDCGGVCYGNLSKSWPNAVAKLRGYGLIGKVPHRRIWLGHCDSC